MEERFCVLTPARLTETDIAKYVKWQNERSGRGFRDFGMWRCGFLTFRKVRKSWRIV